MVVPYNLDGQHPDSPATYIDHSLMHWWPFHGRVRDLAGITVLTGTASQSSQHDSTYLAKFGNDGISDSVPLGAQVVVTATEDSPWWQVDLGQVHSVHVITFTNRDDGQCASRMFTGSSCRYSVPWAPRLSLHHFLVRSHHSMITMTNILMIAC